MLFWTQRRAHDWTLVTATTVFKINFATPGMHSFLLSASRGDICSSLLWREEGIHVKECGAQDVTPTSSFPARLAASPPPSMSEQGTRNQGALPCGAARRGGLLPGLARGKLGLVARGKQGPELLSADVTILSRSRSRSHLQVWSPFPVPGSEADCPGEAGGPMLPVWVVPPVASESPRVQKSSQNVESNHFASGSRACVY